MKRLFISILVLGTISCTKEAPAVEEKKIIAVKCSDGAILNSTSKSACGVEYTVTENILLRDAKGNAVYPPIYVEVKTKKTHGYFIEFIYGKGTFCDNFPILCVNLGKNY
jgi:hypothetical protein